MSRIAHVRSVLLSAPYASQASAEVRLHLPAGWRTTGLVEITLDSGIRGLGEAYLAVFAPHVFTAIVDLLVPVLVGCDVNDVEKLKQRLTAGTGYWSNQGAAQHVVSAFEIAFQDCRAQLRRMPVWKLMGGKENRSLKLYASGGDSIRPQEMMDEIETVSSLGIDLFKIRARKRQVAKVAWCQRQSRPLGIEIAVDMTQNLAIPSQSIDDVIGFLHELERRGGDRPSFLEEVIGPLEIHHLAELRARIAGNRIAGGETLTTAIEMRQRLERGYYDIAQPDATVIGGIEPTLSVFEAARRSGAEVYVHCWGGPVGMMANYHAAVAGSGSVAEWPLPEYCLRDRLVVEPWLIAAGRLTLPETHGLGVKLTPEVEEEFSFREDAVYSCIADMDKLPKADWS